MIENIIFLQSFPYVKKAATIWSMHQHWPARGAAKKALQKAGFPGMFKMNKAPLKSEIVQTMRDASVEIDGVKQV